MDHIIEFLGPYLDGELRVSQVKKIEYHLETCDQCRSELIELKNLGVLLQDNAMLPPMKPENQFAAEVGLLLERQPEPTTLQRVMVTGWKAIPVGLAGTWLFVQTSVIVTTLLFSVSRFAPELPGIDRLTQTPEPSVLSNALGSLSQPLITQVLEIITKLLQIDIPLNWQIPVFTLLSFAIGIVYMCWLASWWVVREWRITQETS